MRIAPKSRALRTLAVLALITALVFGVARGARNDYAHVVSIEHSGVYQDAAILARAWALPVAAAYRSVQYDYQSNSSFCGPTSVVDVLRSIGKQQTQDDVLGGSNVWTLFGYVVPAGMTLDELAALLQLKSGLPTKILRDLDLAAFRAELPRMNDPALRYLINFTRGPLFGRGHGHHSPVLGYLADEDLVFIGDVNRDFGPWLVKSERLFEAMNTLDSSSGKKRGLIVVHVAAAHRDP